MLLSACLLKPNEIYCGFSRLQSQFRAHAMKCLTIFFFKKKNKPKKTFVLIQLPSCSVHFHKHYTPHKSLQTTDLWRKPEVG